MKICVTSQGDNLDSQVDQRFGRCQYFIIVDTDTLQFEAIQNPGVEVKGGTGVQSAQIIAVKKARSVLTGNIGPNAFQILQAAGIDIFTDVSGTVREAIDTFKRGKFERSESSSVSSKFGMER